MAVSNTTMKMARIAGIEAAEATDYMTSALRGFNMEVNEMSANRVADVYSELAAKTASNVQELSVAMSKTASLAHNANMEFETTAAFLAQVIETTREAAETAGTAMKTVIARFQELKKNPEEIGEVEGEIVDANKIETALRSIGVALRDTSGEFRDLDDVFIDIASKWDSLDSLSQRYVATLAAGSRQQSRFIAMMSNYDRTMELINMANSSAGASNEQFSKTLDSMETKLAKLKNAWDQFLLGLANNDLIKAAISILTAFLNAINAIIDGLSKATGPLQSWTKSLLSLAATAGMFTIGKKLGTTLVTSFGEALRKGKGEKEVTGFVKRIKNKFKKAEVTMPAPKIPTAELKKQAEIATAEYNASIKQMIAANEKVFAAQEQLKKAQVTPGIVVNKTGETQAQIDAQTKLNAVEEEAKKIEEANKVVQEASIKTEGLYTAQLRQEELFQKANTDQRIAYNAAIEAGVSSKEAEVLLTEQDTQATWLKIAGDNVDLKNKWEEIETEKKVQLLRQKGIAGKLAAAIASKASAVATKTETGATSANTASGWANVKATVAQKIANLGLTQSLILAHAAMLLMVAAAVGLVVAIAAIISAVRKNTISYKMEQAAKATQAAEEAAEDAKSAYDDLLSTKDSYDDNIKAIEEMTRGTDEWRQKTLEVNQEVLDLISKYKELVNYIDRSNGYLTISKEGWDVIADKSEETVENAQMSLSMSQANEAALAIEQASQNIKDELIEMGDDTRFQSLDVNIGEKWDTVSDELVSAYREGLLTSFEDLQKILNKNNIWVDQSVWDNKYFDNYIDVLATNTAAINENTVALQTDLKNAIESGLSDQASNSNYADQITNEIASAYAENMGMFKEQLNERKEVLTGNDLDALTDALTTERHKEGGDLRDLRAVYKALTGVETIPDELKDDRNALRTEIAKLQLNEDLSKAASRIIEAIEDATPEKQSEIAGALSSGGSGMTTQQVEKYIEMAPDDIDSAMQYFQNLFKGFSVEDIGLKLGLSFEDGMSEAKKWTMITQQIARNAADQQNDFNRYLSDYEKYADLSHNTLQAEIQGQLDRIKALDESLTFAEQRRFVDALGKAELRGGDATALGRSIWQVIQLGITRGVDKSQIIDLFLAEGALDDSTAVNNTLDQVDELIGGLGGPLRESIVEANAAIKTFNVEPLIEQLDSVIDVLDKIRDAEDVERTFSKEEYTTIIEAAPEEKENFVARGTDEFIYIGSSLDSLAAAIEKNTAATMESTRVELENAVNKGERILEQSSKDDWHIKIDGEILGLEEFIDRLESLSLTNENGVTAAIQDVLQNYFSEDRSTWGNMNLEEQAAWLKNQSDQYIKGLANLRIQAEEFQDQVLESEFTSLNGVQEILDKEVTTSKNRAATEQARAKAIEAQYQTTDQAKAYFKALGGEAKDASGAISHDSTLLKAHAVNLAQVTSRLQTFQSALMEAADALDPDNFGTAEFMSAMNSVINAFANMGVQLDSEFFTNSAFYDILQAMSNATEGSTAAERGAHYQYAQEAESKLDDFMAGVLTKFAPKAQSALQDIVDKVPVGSLGIDISKEFDRLAEALGSQDRARQLLEAYKVVATTQNGKTVAGQLKTRLPNRDFEADRQEALENAQKAAEEAQERAKEQAEAAYEAEKKRLEDLEEQAQLEHEAERKRLEEEHELLQTLHDLKNPFDWLYNLIQEIDYTSEEISRAEREYDIMLEGRNATAEELAENLGKQAALLEVQLEENELMIEKRLEEAALLEQQNQDLAKFADYDRDRNVITIDWNAIQDVRDTGDEDTINRIEEYVSKLEAIQDDISQSKDVLLESEEFLNGIKDEFIDNAIDMEEQVKDLLVEEYQRQIDALSNINDTINETNERIVQGMQDALDKYRQERENEEKQEKLAEKERRLAYLRQDTANANQEEIMSLESDLADERQDFTDTLIDQKINELEEQNALAAEQRERQIEIQQYQLDQAVATGQIWQEVHDILSTGLGQDGALSGRLQELFEGSEAFKESSTTKQDQMKEEFTNQANEMKSQAGMLQYEDEQWYLEHAPQWLQEQVGTPTTDAVHSAQDAYTQGKDETLGQISGSEQTLDAAIGMVRDKLPDPYSVNEKIPTAIEALPEDDWENEFTTKLKELEEAHQAAQDKTNQDLENAAWTQQDWYNSFRKLTDLSYDNAVPVKDPETKSAILGLQNAFYNPKRYEYDQYGTGNNQIGQGNGLSPGDTGKRISGLAYNQIPGYAAATGNTKLKDLTSKDLLGAQIQKNEDNRFAVQLKDGSIVWIDKWMVTKAYKEGGLADYTGPAWLDGTKTKPELVLNARDTQNFIALRDILDEAMRGGALGQDNTSLILSEGFDELKSLSEYAQNQRNTQIEILTRQLSALGSLSTVSLSSTNSLEQYMNEISSLYNATFLSRR